MTLYKCDCGQSATSLAEHRAHLNGCDVHQELQRKAEPRSDAGVYEKEQQMDGMKEAPKPEFTNELDLKDLCNARMVIGAIISALNEGPKSRARSLVITKLEEASMWANEGLRLE